MLAILMKGNMNIKCKVGFTYSSLLIPFRSFKSAPAQKHSSTSLASVRTLVP